MGLPGVARIIFINERFPLEQIWTFASSINYGDVTLFLFKFSENHILK